MPQAKPSQPQLRRSKSGFQLGAMLVETMLAAAIVAIFLSGLYAANGRVWTMLRASLESNSACRVLNGRAEQLRASTWDQVTRADFLRTSILSVAPDSGGDLGALTETINVK